MRKKMKIMISSLSSVVVLAGASIPFIIHGVNSHHGNDNPSIKESTLSPTTPPALKPTTPEIPSQAAKITNASGVFSNAKLQIPFKASLSEKLVNTSLSASNVYQLSDIIASNIVGTTIMIKGQPNAIKSADLLALATISGVQKQVNAKVIYDLNLNQYDVYNLKINEGKTSDITPDTLKPASDITPAMSNITPAPATLVPEATVPGSNIAPIISNLTPDRLKPASDLTPGAISNITPATSIFSNNRLRNPIESEINNHLINTYQSSVYQLSDIIASNITTTNSDFLIHGQPIITKTADILTIATIAGVNKQVTAKVSYRLDTNTYYVFDLAINEGPASDITPDTLKPASDLTPAISNLTPATMIFGNDKLRTPFQTQVATILAKNNQYKVWTLSDIIATNIKNVNSKFLIHGDLMNFKTADLLAIATIAGVEKQVTAKVVYDFTTNKYNIYNLKINWSSTSDLTPDTLKPASDLTPGAISNLTPETTVPNSDLTPEATVPGNELTPTINIFSNNRLRIPFQASLSDHLSAKSSHEIWMLSDIIANNINDTNILVSGKPVTLRSADLLAIGTIAGIQREVTAKVIYDFSTSKYTISDTKIIYRSMDSLTPTDNKFNIFEVKAKNDLTNHLSSITNALSVDGWNRIKWNNNDDYHVSVIQTNHQNKTISARLTNDTQSQYVNIRIGFYNNRYNALNWETSSTVTSFYTWEIFANKAIKDLNNRANYIAQEFAFTNWKPTDHIVSRKHYTTDKRSWIDTQLINETRNEWSSHISIHYHSDRPYTIDQWVW